MARFNFQVVFLFIFVLISLPGFAQNLVAVPIDSVDFNKIQQMKIRKLISKQKQYGVGTFDEIRPVCYNTQDSGNYRTYTKSQLIRQDINVVWNNLICQSPGDEFDGRIVTFGLLYSKSHKNLIYINDSYAGIEEGQLLFFNLRVLSGIKNIAVALEVTRMDNENKEIEYCYIDHGDTRGTQKFTLKQTPEGLTEITQITKYSCKSRLRERRLYSFFHERIVKEFFNSLKVKSENIISSRINDIKATGTTG